MRIQALRGIKQHELQPILKTGLGFKLWVKATFPGSVGTHPTEGETVSVMYLGVNDLVGTHTWKNVIVIRGAETKQADREVEWEATDVIVYSHLTILDVADVNNRQSEVLFAVGVRYNEQNQIDVRKVLRPKDWVLTSWKDWVLTLPRNSDLARGAYDTLYGTLAEYKTQLYSEFRESAPALYDRVCLDTQSELGRSLRMAEVTESGRIVPPDQVRALKELKAPEDLCVAYWSELKDAVTKDPLAFFGRFTPWQVGRIAALALNESLSVHRVEKSNRSGTEYKIIARYRDFGSTEMKLAMFEFSTSDDKRWRLTRFPGPLHRLKMSNVIGPASVARHKVTVKNKTYVKLLRLHLML
ncbi:MAG TPA: hypothetical protein VLH56_03095 [Dissulfurispiraceae bacterium]|nr:hypothetical protein [Dissulfurispiraceae bacterium]